jgi:PKD repeat protein
VTVNDVAPTVSLNNPGLGIAGDNVYFTANATDISPADQAAGFTYSWNFGDGGTAIGVIPAHTYATAGTYTVTVTATDQYGESGTASGTITIVSGSGSTPYGGTAWPAPGVIQAENFDNGGQNVAYFTPHPGTGGDPYRGTSIGITQTTDTGGGYLVGWTFATEWINYTIDVAASGSYLLGIRVASGVPGLTFHVDFGGVNMTGTLSVPNTGGWQTWVTVTTNVQLTAGQQIMQIDFDNNGATNTNCNVNWLQLTATSNTAVRNAGTNLSVNAGADATFAGTVSGGIAMLGVPVTKTLSTVIAGAGSPDAINVGDLNFMSSSNLVAQPDKRFSRNPLDGV